MFTFKIECLVFPSSVPQFVISVLVPLFKLSWEQFLQQRHLLCSCSWETTGFQYCISVTCRSVFFLRVLIRSKMFSIGKNFSKKKKKPFFSWYLKGLEISAKLFYQYLCIFSISKVLILFFFFYSGPTTFMGGRIDGWFWKPTHSVITSLKMKQNMAAEALSAWVKLWLQ